MADIVNARRQDCSYDANYVVLGDFNDNDDAGTELGPLLNHPGLVNVLRRLPADEQWTHFYAGKKEYRQVDYILLSKSLAAANPGAPEVMRKGLPWRAEKYTGDRFAEVGEDNPKASDHAPVCVEIELQ